MITKSRPRVMITTGAADLFNGFKRYDLWGRLGFLEVKRRYRRTVIGPFWSAISLGVFVIVMGTVGVGLWKRDAREYLPFLASGLMVWHLISTIITESCMVFINGLHLFARTRIDFSLLAYALVWRNLVAFFHNVVAYFVVVILFAPKLLGLNTLLAVPGLLLVAVNAVWVVILLGLICTRFRDVQQLVTTLLQISLFVTPIFWPPEMLTGPTRPLFVDYNPLYCFIDVVRSPLIGEQPTLHSYGVIFALMVIGWAITFAAFTRYRSRIAFWV
jgi:ABC-type polysaccharide/polyol phosphate export permease